MSLSSTSTAAEIIAAYADNADYELSATPSVGKARLFAQACRILLAKMPKMNAQDRGSVQLSPELVAAELERALAFLALTPDLAALETGGGGIRYFDTSNYRDELGGCGNVPGGCR